MASSRFNIISFPIYILFMDPRCLWLTEHNRKLNTDDESKLALVGPCIRGHIAGIVTSMLPQKKWTLLEIPLWLNSNFLLLQYSHHFKQANCMYRIKIRSQLFIPRWIEEASLSAEMSKTFYQPTYWVDLQ